MNFFDKYLIQPIFNLLEFIYAVVPGHDLGIAIIIFTALIRLALWPLVKKQLHQSRAMRRLQPKLKDLKKAANGDRQKEARLQMELYKEHGVKPFSTIGTLIIQIPIFIALYQSVLKLVNDSNILLTFSYDSVRDLPWIHQLAADMSQFSYYFLGFADLSRKAIGDGGVYVPALIIAITAAVAQYYQSKLLMLDNKDSKKLSEIMKEASQGRQADQGEIGAAIGRNMLYFMPFLTFGFTAVFPSALGLYILTTSAVGYFQQAYILRQDKDEMHELAVEGEIIEKQALSQKKKKKKPSKPKKRKKK
jgi:YidC/Oxa1 family membrane protein insertase